ncbi:MAG: NAD(P)-dependent oxidoreductase [Candidatus Thermoplasmatota archaeon]|nr:NAD(P)-dependent oxidoreductase [Candidatus Thermoplasmatota archaeon]
MKVAVSAPDRFVAPYILDMLGDSAVEIPPEAMEDQMTLDALLTSCNAIVHINSKPIDSTFSRDDRETLLRMREQSRPILDAVDRHGELHLIIVGTLRVHPQWEPDEPYYGYDSTLAPRDTAAEGQLWMEEMALERAQAERPVSIIRASNVQGVLLDGSEANGLLHQWAMECMMGWINIPGDGSDVKDFVHVQDLVTIIGAVLENPPPTRESISVGSGKAISMADLAAMYNQKTGCESEYGQDDSQEVFGIVDARELEMRFGFSPEISLEEMLQEAFEFAGH